MTSFSPFSKARWLNSTVIGIGLASFFSDLSHETATAILPAFIASLGGSAAVLGLIEGISDGVSSFAKMGAGWWSDRLQRRKILAVAGYATTALAMGSIAFAHNVWHAGLARVIGWFGRGIRTPVRKALLAASVRREHYGRAFGFERAMDETGGLLGALAAIWLVVVLPFPSIFLWTMLPGFLSVLAITFLVSEPARLQISHFSLAHSLKELPQRYRRLLIGVSLFGLGDFSKSLLILMATQNLAPQLGTAKAASTALILYLLHKIFYMTCSYPMGRLGDTYNKRKLLTAVYILAAVMGLLLTFYSTNLGIIVTAFVLSGIYVAGQDTLEDALAAELVDEKQHGVAFGTLATVNGIGDFISSALVGILWTIYSPAVAFGYATAMFIAGAIILWRWE